MAYLLTGISTLAKAPGYSGLCILIDEAKSHSLLTKGQQPKASLFSNVVIRAALRDDASHDPLPQHRHRDYPVHYGPREAQALFFLFTVTRSDNALPLEAWLRDEEVFLLEPHHTPNEIGEFLAKLQAHHALAYGYESAERQGQLHRAAAEHLSFGMQRGELSPRGVVRLSTELFDLLYLHPEWEIAELLEELRETLR